MKLADFVVDFLVKQEVDTVFGVTGGAVAHLFDAVARHPNLRSIFTHHEQAAAFAAQSYARFHRRLGCAFVTTGPGGTNALTGVCAAWLDSIPCLYISGQTRLAHTTQGKPLRQVGSQQLDIVTLVKPITKWATILEEPTQVRYTLEKAVHIATSGRPGPVWIDIPLDLQWQMIDEYSLSPFFPEPQCIPNLDTSINAFFTNLAAATRPLLLIGHGVRLAGAERLMVELIQCLQIPYVSSWNASDILPTEDPLYVGRPGIFGQRGANFAMQNCDFLLCLGSHLCVSITGTLFKAFARAAKIAMVNIDPNEIAHSRIPVDLPIHADAKLFLQKALAALKVRQPSIHCQEFKEKCQLYKQYNSISHNPTIYGCKEEDTRVNPYHFLDRLSNHLSPQDVIVVDGGGTIVQIAFQSLRIKKGQRIIIDSGLCAMGSGLPQSIGAYFGSGGQRVICLCGDGSFQFNIHELQTIVHHKLPIKVFIFNNNGYLSIRHTQAGFLNHRYIGSSQDGGISIPNILKISQAYGIKTYHIKNQHDLQPSVFQLILDDPGPIVCELIVSPELLIAPRQGFRQNPDETFAPAPLEEMIPFLKQEEFTKCMLIDQWPV